MKRKAPNPSSLGERVLRSKPQRMLAEEKATDEEKKTVKIPKQSRVASVKKPKPPKSPKPVSQTHIDSLPEEILGRIFQLLPWRDRVMHLEHVSRRWNAVVRRLGWADPVSFDYKESKSKRKKPVRPVQKWWHSLPSADDLQRVGVPRIQELWLGSAFNDVNLRPYIKPCQQLQHLGLYSVGLTAGRIRCIREEMGARLRSLSLNNCFLPDTSTIAALGQLLTTSPNLTCLRIGQPLSQYNQSFTSLLATRGSLRLPLGLHCLELQEQAAMVLSFPTAVSSLSSLHTDIADGHLRDVHPSWPLEQLSHLSIALPAKPDPDRPGEDSLFAILDRAKQLRALELSSVPVSVIAKLPDHPCLEHLEHLTLSVRRCTNEPAMEPVLTSILQQFGGLRSLRVRNVSSQEVLSGFQEVASCWSELEYFYLESRGWGHEIPVDVLTEVLLKCKKLRAIRFELDRCLTPEDYLEIAPLCEGGGNHP